MKHLTVEQKITKAIIKINTCHTILTKLFSGHFIKMDDYTKFITRLNSYSNSLNERVNLEITHLYIDKIYTQLKNKERLFKLVK